MMQAETASADAAAALTCELATEVLRSFGSVRFKEKGWSMLPALRPGDTLVIERVRAAQVQSGDVVLVRRNGRLCSHRVVSMAGDSENPRWITQGDALPAPDRPVEENELLGRVDYVIRAGKLIAVRAEPGMLDRWMGKIVRRSFLAARAFVYLHSRMQTREEPVLPCQG